MSDELPATRTLHPRLDRAPPRDQRMVPTPPTPTFTGSIGIDELQWARHLLAQGLELDRHAQRRIVDFAIGLAARAEVRHDEACGVWRSQACSCAEGG